MKKPLQTSIAVEADEFDDVDVEDKLHIVISVQDFRAIIQHAGIAGSDISARYSLPARPIQLAYSGDAISCEFLIMTVGERGNNPTQKTKKGRKTAPQNTGPRLEAISRKTSVAPSEAPEPNPQPQQPTPFSPRPPQSSARPIGTARASASRMAAFDLRPSQKPPPPTLRSESLFVDDEGWEPVRDEDEGVEGHDRLGWDHSADPGPVSTSTNCKSVKSDEFRIRLSVPIKRKQHLNQQRSLHNSLVPTQHISNQHKSFRMSHLWRYFPIELLYNVQISLTLTISGE